MPRVLHLLSQRPSRTGSGITLREIIRLTSHSSWDQAAVVGLDSLAEEDVSISGLDPSQFFPLYFRNSRLPFAIPGMSDVMPYESRTWSSLSTLELDLYRQSWREHLQHVLKRVQPDVLHVHHMWLLLAIVRDLAPEIPILLHCHATGMRQMDLCPHLKEEVLLALKGVDAIAVLHGAQKEKLVSAFEVEARKVHVVGAGYRDSIFLPRTDSPKASSVLYAGKFARAKGLDILLEQVEALSQAIPDFCLHLAGAGSGTEGTELADLAQSLAPKVKIHGILSQEELASLMRETQLFILPSLYEGLPLVLIEALACGCRLVATDLPGVRELMNRGLSPFVHVIQSPRLLRGDQLHPDDRESFARNVRGGILAALDEGSMLPASQLLCLKGFSWSNVFDQIEKLWVLIGKN